MLKGYMMAAITAAVLGVNKTIKTIDDGTAKIVFEFKIENDQITITGMYSELVEIGPDHKIDVTLFLSEEMTEEDLNLFDQNPLYQNFP